MKPYRLAAGCALALAGLFACASQPGFAASTSQSSPSAAPAPLSPQERGDVFLARGEYQAAIEAYREAPQSAEILNKTGIAYQHLGAIGLARRNYQKALALRHDFPEAMNNLGSAWFADRNYKKAIKLYLRARRMMPDSAVIAANLGTAYFARGKYQPGLDEYRAAFRLDPDVFSNQDNAMISGPTNQIDRAQQDFCIAELFAQAGMQARAIEYLRKALDEGFTNRHAILQNADFSKLRQNSEFAMLMHEQQLH